MEVREEPREALAGPICERCGQAPARFPCICEAAFCEDCYLLELEGL